MSESWEIRDRSEALRAFRWSVERSMRQRAGDDQAYEFFTVRIADFVNVFPLTADGDLIFVRQFRHGIEAPTLEPPGGLVDAGEDDPMAAARREMLEETGFDGTLEPLGVVHPNPAMLNNRAFFYLARDATRVTETALEATEDIRTVRVPLREMDNAIRDGRITNALIISGLKLLDLALR